MIYSKPFNGDYAVTSGYGSRKDPFTGKDSFHNGIDFAVPENTPLFNLEPGVVLYAGVIDWFNPNSGNLAVGVKADSDGVVAVYMHMNRIDVKVGQRVELAQQIGLSGNTGYSTAPHLHFGLYPRLASGSWNETIDPTFLLDIWKNPNDIINPQTNMFKDKLTQTIPTMGFDPATQSQLLASVSNEDATYLLTFAGTAPRNDLAKANQKIAELEAELAKEPTKVEIVNPVNVDLQNKVDSLEKENKSLTEMLLVANKSSLVSNPDEAKPSLLSIPEEVKPAQPLPIWQRSFYDTFRNGTYALAGVLATTGVWDMVQVYLTTGDFNSESFSKLVISAGAVLAGYLQEQAKNNRKEAEKKI